MEIQTRAYRRRHMKRLLAAVVMVGGLGLAPGALAQEGGGDSVKIIQEEDRTVYRKKTVIDFTDVAVEGELTKPEGSYVLNRKKTDFQSLIKVRENFDPELQKSADNL
jgi:hypothetical protein